MWGHVRSLQGRRIVLTQALYESGTLTEILETLKAFPIVYPCVEIEPADNSVLRGAIKRLDWFDWIVITSPQAAYALSQFNVSFDGKKLAVVGKEARHMVSNHIGRDVDFVATSNTSLGNDMPLQDGEVILFTQSDTTDKKVSEILSARGGDITMVPAYKITVGHGGSDLPKLIERGKVDAITFTSPEAVENLTTRLGNTPTWIRAFCFGEKTWKMAENYSYEKTSLTHKSKGLRQFIYSMDIAFSLDE